MKGDLPSVMTNRTFLSDSIHQTMESIVYFLSADNMLNSIEIIYKQAETKIKL